jgi:hypothetical protein
MRYENSEFRDVTQHLDGNEFIRCTFRNAELVFSGLAPVSLAECSFYNVRWSFAGSAALTINFMTGLYHGAGVGGRDLIENTFRNIREGTVHPAEGTRGNVPEE